MTAATKTNPAALPEVFGNSQLSTAPRMPSGLNSQFLQQHFDTLAETPEAVAKLRAFVLDLAVRGRLVPQAGKPDKNPAWQKFCRELAERVYNSEKPSLFEIPNGWRWVELNAVAEPCGQKKPDERFTYVDVGTIDNMHGVIMADVQVLNADEAPSRARKLVRSNP